MCYYPDLAELNQDGLSNKKEGFLMLVRDSRGTFHTDTFSTQIHQLSLPEILTPKNLILPEKELVSSSFQACSLLLRTVSSAPCPTLKITLNYNFTLI